MEQRYRNRWERRADLVFAVEDPFRNIVRLERDSWEIHITRKHPEVDGLEQQARKLIEEPDAIYESTLDMDTAVFESKELRAVVMFEATEYPIGDTFGKVVTVYPNDGKPLSTIGRVIHRKDIQV